MEWFDRARSDPSLVILEGFHTVKHAHRFGADLLTVIHSHNRPLDELVETLAPEMLEVVEGADQVAAEDFAALFRHPHPTGIAAVARRPVPVDTAQIRRDAPLVLLDQPRHLGNIGATIRICAAGGAAGVIALGDIDPWHPAAMRGSAGLHFAVPTLQVSKLPVTDRPIIAFDPDGDDGSGFVPPNDAILAFGSERTGLSDMTKQAADRLIAFPMSEGVSSINLAASVGIGLYMWRLHQPRTSRPIG